MSAPNPDEILDDLDSDGDTEDESDIECVYIDRADPAYLWVGEDDGEFIYLEQSRNGSWLPCGRPIDEDTAEKILDDAIDDSTAEIEIRPQTELPPGRHRWD
mgnify:CR=1 FL=1